MAVRSSLEIQRLLGELKDLDRPAIGRAEAAETLGHISVVSKNHQHVNDHVQLGAVRETILESIFDKHGCVQVAATHAIEKCARRGDQAVVDALMSKLNDRDALVRRATYQSLGLMASRGDFKVVTALLNKVKVDEENLSKVAAIEALSHVALELNDPDGPDMLDFKVTLRRDLARGDTLGFTPKVTQGGTARIACIEEGGHLDRWNAKHPEALVQSGDHIVEVNGIWYSSEDRETTIFNELRRQNVVHMTIDRNAGVIHGLSELMMNSSNASNLRRAATDSLRMLAAKGDKEVVDRLFEVLDREGPTSSVIRALGAIAHTKHERMLSVMAGPQGLGAPDPLARFAAHEALTFRAAEAFPGQDQGEVLTALQGLVSDDYMDRCQAIKTLGEISIRGDGAAVQGLVARLDDEHTLVRADAAKVLGEIAEIGDQGVIDALIVALNFHEVKPTASGLPEDLRSRAAKALGEIAQPGDVKVTRALWRSLNDPSKEVRAIALKAHSKIDPQASLPGYSLWHNIPLVGQQNKHQDVVGGPCTKPTYKEKPIKSRAVGGAHVVICEFPK